VSRALVIAHRGASGYEVENSLAAFRAARTLGADAVELDIHETADGAFIVHHGNMVGQHHISHRTLWQLREQSLPNGEPIPTLEEALAVILPEMIAYVETKKISPERDERLAAIIDASAAPQRVAIHAFDHRIIPASYPVNPVRCLEDADAHILWQEWPFIDEQMVRAVHVAGMSIYAWTVNAPDGMAQLLSLGVDALVTDFPDVARAAVDSLPQ